MCQTTIVALNRIHAGSGRASARSGAVQRPRATVRASPRPRPERQRPPHPRPRPPEQEQRRRDRQQQDVLEHVHPEQLVRVVVDRRVERDHDRQQAREERGGLQRRPAATGPRLPSRYSHAASAT